MLLPATGSLICLGALIGALTYANLSVFFGSTLLLGSLIGRAVVVGAVHVLLMAAKPLIVSNLRLLAAMVNGRGVVGRCFQFLRDSFLPLTLPFLRPFGGLVCAVFWCCDCCCCLRFPLMLAANFVAFVIG